MYIHLTQWGPAPQMTKTILVHGTCKVRARNCHCTVGEAYGAGKGARQALRLTGMLRPREKMFLEVRTLQVLPAWQTSVEHEEELLQGEPGGNCRARDTWLQCALLHRSCNRCLPARWNARHHLPVHKHSGVEGLLCKIQAGIPLESNLWCLCILAPPVAPACAQNKATSSLVQLGDSLRGGWLFIAWHATRPCGTCHI